MIVTKPYKMGEVWIVLSRTLTAITFNLLSSGTPAKTSQNNYVIQVTWLYKFKLLNINKFKDKVILVQVEAVINTSGG